MKLGFSLPVAGPWATPAHQVTLAQHAEALGYDSVWVFQRLLYALEPRNSPFPGHRWPTPFERVVDPIVTLAYVAAATTRIRLGTSVLIMAYYSPILLAKQLATLDLVSGGRLHVGLGIGWSVDEYDAVGIPLARRGRRADEFLRCLDAVWTQDPVEFRGEFYRVPRSRVEPKPIQKPRPPLTLGGQSPAVLERAVRLADGFNGNNVALVDVPRLVANLRAAARAAGRDPGDLHVVNRVTFRVHDVPQGPARRPLHGTLDEIRDDVWRYAEAGVTELFFEVNFEPAGGELQRVLDVMVDLAPRQNRR